MTKNRKYNLVVRIAIILVVVVIIIIPDPGGGVVF
jgi:hypothetical protein